MLQEQTVRLQLLMASLDDEALQQISAKMDTQDMLPEAGAP